MRAPELAQQVGEDRADLVWARVRNATPIDVSVSLNKLGDLYLRRGQRDDAAEAVRCFQESLAVREQLRADNPRSAEAARGLVVSRYKLAACAAQTSDSASELQYRRECYAVLHPIISAGVDFDPPIMSLYQQLHAQFGGEA